LRMVLINTLSQLLFIVLLGPLLGGMYREDETTSNPGIKPEPMLKHKLRQAKEGEKLYLYGSAASRRPSPKKLKAKTTIMTNNPGIKSQG